MNNNNNLEQTCKGNKISGEGMKALGKMLKINTTLSTLRFSGLQKKQRKDEIQKQTNVHLVNIDNIFDLEGLKALVEGFNVYGHGSTLGLSSM